MTAANPDEIACRYDDCDETFEGPDRRRHYANHLHDEHAIPNAPPVAVAPLAPAPPTPAPPTPAPTAPGEFACLCGRTFATQPMLGGHLGGSKKKGEPGHGIAGAPPAPEPTPTPAMVPATHHQRSCPECDRVFGSPQGLAVHRGRAHGTPPPTVTTNTEAKVTVPPRTTVTEAPRAGSETAAAQDGGTPPPSEPETPSAAVASAPEPVETEAVLRLKISGPERDLIEAAAFLDRATVSDYLAVLVGKIMDVLAADPLVAELVALRAKADAE